jgi:hypothetical protein
MRYYGANATKLARLCILALHGCYARYRRSAVRDYLREEGRVIKQAPVAFAFAVAILSSIAGFIIFEFVDSRYSHEMAALRAAVDQQRSANENLQARIGLLEARGANDSSSQAHLPPVQAQKADGSLDHPYATAADCPRGYTILEDSMAALNGGSGYIFPPNAKICFIRSRAESNRGHGNEMRK